MSAGQPRKRPPNPPPPNHHQQQQHRSSKRPRPDQPPRSPLLTLSSHIHLRWDDRSRRAVPADDQIGLPWRHLAPFLDSPPRARTRLALADVAPVPRRIFSLGDLPLLGGVLSYEVRTPLLIYTRPSPSLCVYMDGWMDAEGANLLF